MAQTLGEFFPGSVSPQKRKRDETMTPQLRNRAIPMPSHNMRKIADVSNALSFNNEGERDLDVSGEDAGGFASARLLTNGDLVVLSGSAITMNLSVVDSISPVSVDISTEGFQIHDLDCEFSSTSGRGNARDTIACDSQGNILISVTAADGTGTSFYQQLELDSAGERITCVEQAGKSFLFILIR
jgi:hypothetical protein